MNHAQDVSAFTQAEIDRDGRQEQVFKIATKLLSPEEIPHVIARLSTFVQSKRKPRRSSSTRIYERDKAGPHIRHLFDAEKKPLTIKAICAGLRGKGLAEDAVLKRIALEMKSRLLVKVGRLHGQGRRGLFSPVGDDGKPIYGVVGEAARATT